MNGKEVTVSIDRLKPAFIVAEDEEGPSKETTKEGTTTWSGRTTKPTVRFQL